MKIVKPLNFYILISSFYSSKITKAVQDARFKKKSVSPCHVRAYTTKLRAETGFLRLRLEDFRPQYKPARRCFTELDIISTRVASELILPTVKTPRTPKSLQLIGLGT